MILFSSTRRHTAARILGLAMAFLLLAFVLAGADSDKESQRPNILLIVADDATISDLGFTGSPNLTPNLDTLAEQGVFFSRYHASPVCSVTRAMLLTGNNPVEVGLETFDYAVYPGARGARGYETYLTRNAVALPELLDDVGYMTIMVGKWHLGGKAAGGQGPHEWGFRRSYTILSGGANHWNSGISLPNLNNPDHVEIAAKARFPRSLSMKTV